MSLHYYNEIDKYCVLWLNNLIDEGHLPVGVVDDRPIQEVQPEDLEPYTSCHFFAGLGGWPYALRLGGWPEDRPVWTGSCPCQPFSNAGAARGRSDERHIWPEFYRLIRVRTPPVVFGEQVEAAVGHGWLDEVFTDLEAAQYACGAAVLGAHSVGAGTVRQRLWWVAHASGEGLAGSLCERGSLRSLQSPSSTKPCDPSLLEGLFDVPHPHDLPNPYGIPRPVGEIKTYGNAIIPQVAAEFIRAYLEAEAEIVGDDLHFSLDSFT